MEHAWVVLAEMFLLAGESAEPEEEKDNRKGDRCGCGESAVEAGEQEAACRLAACQQSQEPAAIPSRAQPPL